MDGRTDIIAMAKMRWKL